MNLTLLPETYSVYKFQKDSNIPAWIYSSGFYSVTGTRDELSVVSVQHETVSEDIVCSKGWRIIKVAGQLDLSLVGVIANISGILREKRIPIFTVSTFNTDYFLVKQKDLNKAIKALREQGHKISKEQ